MRKKSWLVIVVLSGLLAGPGGRGGNARGRRPFDLVQGQYPRTFALERRRRVSGNGRRLVQVARLRLPRRCRTTTCWMRPEAFNAHYERCPIPDAVLAACRKRFGDDWLGDARQEGPKLLVRLKTLDEIRRRPGRAGQIPACRKRGNHLRAGPRQRHQPCGCDHSNRGQERSETLQGEFKAIEEQARARPADPGATSIIPTAATVSRRKCSPRSSTCGPSRSATALPTRTTSATRSTSAPNGCGTSPTPSASSGSGAPLLGVASDDAHNYHQFGTDYANPGRGWVMVRRAGELSIGALLEAMTRGDFYASSGVVLRDVKFDAAQRRSSVEVQPEPGVKYAIEFIGTLEDADIALCEGWAASPGAATSARWRRSTALAPRIV